MEIDARRIDLWFAFLDAIHDPLLLREYECLLTQAEQQRRARFYFDHDKHCYLVTRALLRVVLSRYADVAPTAWRFSSNAYGRPFIANEDVDARRIAFNLSHTRSLVVLAVTHDREIGVDVENVHRGKATVDIADRFFAPAETAALRALPPEEQQQRFFEYWTLKESYIKARGMGLSIPLDEFSFDVAAPGGVQIDIDARQCDRAERWRFWLLQPSAEYLVAVCGERASGETLPLSLTRTVPLLGDEPVDYRVLRSSQ